MRILGLDLGIASIGWALTEQPQVTVENTSQITLVDWGSRIFEPGMTGDIESGKGESRAAQRRLKRSLRIQYWRRRKRRKELIEVLTEMGCLPEPLTAAFFEKMDSALLQHFAKEKRAQLGHVIPYIYRKMALDKDLTPFELGRALYHLAQRRGYKSNRKKDIKADEENGVVLNGIQTLQEDMKHTKARTLAEYFCTLNPEQERIRGRYTSRSMYEEEFRLICERQRKLVSPENEKRLYKAIFYQRPLKSARGLIGDCQFEEGEKRCSFACEEAQLYRIYTTAANLRIQNKTKQIRQLTEQEYGQVVGLLNGYTSKLDIHGKITLANLSKEINLPKGDKFTLGDEEKEIYGNVLHAMLYHVFGDKAGEMTEEQQALFWHDIDSIEKESALRRRLESYWQLSGERIALAAKLVLPDEYCSLSLKALRKILPDLEAGIQLHRILECQYPEKFRSGDAPLELLPSVDDCKLNLRNPVVHRTLTEVRYVVNSIIRRYGKPDYIRIELARDLKSTNKEKKRLTMQNRDNEKERARMAKRILEETGIQNPSRNDILKVRLAEECGFECPYTGQHFSMAQLLDGRTVQIEHIIPFSRSFDDSFRNKTLCMSSENGKKNNRTPYEAYGPEELAKIKARVMHFNGDWAEDKLELFSVEKVDTDEFLARNLNDTRYASKLAMEYLGKLYGGIIDNTGKRRIRACAGGCTALVRRAWGANYLLGDGEKVRDDHRHHAIDALTIAIITDSMVKAVANISKDEYRKRKLQNLPMLDDALYRQARAKLDGATVSHHVVNKLKGALHDETFYSKSEGQTYKRVKLNQLTPQNVPQIRDKAIRLAVYEALGLKDGEAITPKDLDKFKDERHYPVLKDAHGHAVNTIKTVKVLCTGNTRTIGTGDSAREVKTNGNYLFAVYAKTDGNGNDIDWVCKTVSMLDACLRLKKHEPIVEKEHNGLPLKFTLKKGDIVKVIRDGTDELCVVRAFSVTGNTMECDCVPVNEARDQKTLKDAGKYNYYRYRSAKKCISYKMQKVQMNLFGELRRAND